MSFPDATTAYIGLGANLGEPARQVLDAIDRLARLNGVKLSAASSLYRSTALISPYSATPQNDYCNAVAAIETELSPQNLMAALLAIETGMGRLRTHQRWSSRCIDLDLLLYGDCLIDEPGLTVPHPEITKRNFVLIPLAELNPQVMIPAVGEAGKLAAAIGSDGIQRWDDAA